MYLHIETLRAITGSEESKDITGLKILMDNQSTYTLAMYSSTCREVNGCTVYCGHLGDIVKCPV